MCGGACPTEHDTPHSGLHPVFRGIAPTLFVGGRKVRDLPHIRRRSRTLRNQSQLFSQLHCLGSAPGAQLVEQAAGMGLDGGGLTPILVFKALLNDLENVADDENPHSKAISVAL